MKVPPKRKGNEGHECQPQRVENGLNESPSEKEGKSVVVTVDGGISPQPQ